jgi:ABC-type multidrug transport system ATPase subunit
MDDILQLSPGVVSYGDQIVLEVGEISFRQGHLYHIYGDNGSGKTTFLRSILNYKTKFTGEIYYLDLDISGYKTEEILDLGIKYVPQERNAFSRLTIEEHLRLFGKNNFPSPKNQNYKEVITYLGKSSQKGEILSGGQAKLLMLVLIISQNPSLILFDEPFAALDDVSLQMITEIIVKEKNNGKTFIITDHTNTHLNYSSYFQITNTNSAYKIIKV